MIKLRNMHNYMKYFSHFLGIIEPGHLFRHGAIALNQLTNVILKPQNATDDVIKTMTFDQNV